MTNSIDKCPVEIPYESSELKTTSSPQTSTEDAQLGAQTITYQRTSNGWIR